MWNFGERRETLKAKQTFDIVESDRIGISEIVAPFNNSFTATFLKSVANNDLTRELKLSYFPSRLFSMELNSDKVLCEIKYK